MLKGCRALLIRDEWSCRRAVTTWQQSATFPNQVRAPTIGRKIALNRDLVTENTPSGAPPCIHRQQLVFLSGTSIDMIKLAIVLILSAFAVWQITSLTGAKQVFLFSLGGGLTSSVIKFVQHRRAWSKLVLRNV